DADVVLARVLVTLEERVAGHQHAGGTVAALEPVLLDEGLLERMELPVPLEPLHREHLAAVGLDTEDGARLDRPPVEQHGAGAAVAGVAADVGPGEPEALAEQVDQQEPRLDVGGPLLAVDRDLDLHSSSSIWSRRLRPAASTTPLPTGPPRRALPRAATPAPS